MLFFAAQVPSIATSRCPTLASPGNPNAVRRNDAHSWRHAWPSTFDAWPGGPCRRGLPESASRSGQHTQSWTRRFVCSDQAQGEPLHYAA